MLAEDPLTETEGDAFILRWIATGLRWLGVMKGNVPSEEDDDAHVIAWEDVQAAASARRPRVPFGPFLILACLELLFAGEWIASRFSAF